MSKNPSNRPTLEETLKEIKSIKSLGNEEIDFTSYMELLKNKIIYDPSSLGLPENIEDIKKLYIKTEVTNLDACKYPNLEREDLV